jgi:transcriptional regulator with XRE-family HTH domain
MSPAQAPYPRSRRTEVGAELRRLRLLAGLGGREIGDAIGASQSTVSRIEAGLTAVNLPQVRAWGEAAGADAGGLARLERLAAQALTETVSIQDWQQAAGPDGMQAEIADLERSAQIVTGFQPCFVPGLLQTAEYARRVLLTLGHSGSSLEAALAARLERQASLHDVSRNFEFVLTEAAVRWRSGDAGTLLPQQLDRIASVATLANVTVRVIPLGVDMHTAPVCAFWLYEGRSDDEPALAAVETPHARLEVVGNTADVQAYRDEAALLRRSALPDDETVRYLRELASTLA